MGKTPPVPRISPPRPRLHEKVTPNGSAHRVVSRSCAAGSTRCTSRRFTRLPSGCPLLGAGVITAHHGPMASRRKPLRGAGTVAVRRPVAGVSHRNGICFLCSRHDFLSLDAGALNSGRKARLKESSRARGRVWPRGGFALYRMPSGARWRSGTVDIPRASARQSKT